MNIEIGDRVTYRIKRTNRITTSIIDTATFAKDFENENFIEVLKVERPNWEVVEKKELLTEEEKEFLKQIFKFKAFNLKINCIGFDGYRIEFMESEGIVVDYMFIKKRIF